MTNNFIEKYDVENDQWTLIQTDLNNTTLYAHSGCV